MSAPTQVRHPWRTTVRTGFQIVVASATLLPLLFAGVDVPPGGMLAQVLADNTATPAKPPVVRNTTDKNDF